MIRMIGLCATFLYALSLFAQTATLRGQVNDESGAVIPGAKVSLAGPSGLNKRALNENPTDGSF